MRDSRIGALPASALRAISALGVAFPAAMPAARAADAIAPVIAKTCAGRLGQEVSRDRLAESVLYEAGILSEDIEADVSLGDATVALAAKRFAALSRGFVNGASPAANDAIQRLVFRLEQALAPTSTQSASTLGLKAENAPAGYDWLFAGSSSVKLTCLTGKEPEAITTQFDKGVQRERFAFRKTPEELGLTGEEAKKAGAGQFGFKREVAKQDDGSSKTTTNVTIDATAGIRLTPNSFPSPIYAYGSYTLSHKRVDPPPKLDPGKKQSDDDTDALEFGLSTNSFLARSKANFSLVAGAQLGYVVDYADDARRARLRLGLTPGTPWSLGPICDIGGFNDVDIGFKFRTRCLLTLEAEASHVFKAGTADFHDHGEFLGLGGKVSYELAAPIAKDAAVLASLTYRRLPTIWGKAPDVRRWDGLIKYRFYAAGPLGFDLGLTWGKGTEPKSLKEEDKIEFSIGVIY